MVLKFATKRDRNGNRHYLEIDTDARHYCRQSQWWHRSDFVEVTRSEMDDLIAVASSDGYNPVIRL